MPMKSVMRTARGTAQPMPIFAPVLRPEVGTGVLVEIGDVVCNAVEDAVRGAWLGSVGSVSKFTRSVACHRT